MHVCNFMLHCRLSLSLCYLFFTTLSSMRCWEVRRRVIRTQGDEVVVRHWRAAADDCTEVISCRHPWRGETGNKPINIYYKESILNFIIFSFIIIYSSSQRRAWWHHVTWVNSSVSVKGGAGHSTLGEIGGQPPHKRKGKKQLCLLLTSPLWWITIYWQLHNSWIQYQKTKRKK